MATKQRVPGSQRFDASKASKNKGIPKFVFVPTGEFEMTDSDPPDFKLDDDGDPIEKTKRLFVQRTGEALKAIVGMGDVEPDYELDEKGDPKVGEDGEKIVARGQAGRNIDQLYDGLASLLRDPEDDMRNVDAEWLAEHLDFEIANDWMEMFVPSGNAVPEAEGNAASDSERAPSPTTTKPDPEPASSEV